MSNTWDRYLKGVLADIPAANTVPAGTLFFASDARQLVVSNGTIWSYLQGVPSAETADRALTDADNGQTLVLDATHVFTVPTGLILGFGCAFVGEPTFAGSTATVTDHRVAGATDIRCFLQNTGTDTYDVVGGKA